MPGETSTYKIKFSKATDEIRGFPTEVSEPGAKTIEKVIEEHTLTVKTRAASYEAKSGEFGAQEKAGETTTLPSAAPANQIIGVFCTTTSCKITTSGGAFIYGDFISVASKTTTITLLESQHVLLLSGGVNWLIIAGEPNRGEAYSASTERVAGEYEPSATRPTLVTGYVATHESKPTEVNILVGGKVVQKAYSEAGANSFPLSFICPAGVKYKIEKSGGSSQVFTNYLTQ